MKSEMMELLRHGRPEEAAALAARARGGVRALTARLWDTDVHVSLVAAEAVGRLSALAPAKLDETLRRFIWALNDESGTNGGATLRAMAAVARQKPAALAPHLGALVALLDDDGLRPEIVSVLETVARTAPDVVETLRPEIHFRAEALHDVRLAALAAKLEGGGTNDQAT